jgi:hypothetical protein
LRAAFARLQPQGSDAWNFLAAFTHLGDQYGPYQPGASEVSKLLLAPAAPEGGRGRTRGAAWKRRVPDEGAGASPGAVLAAAGPQAELSQAMAQVVEAFRFLAGRVATLERQLARRDRPVEGAAWLAPAPELGEWVEPVRAHLVALAAPEVLHGDCGEGRLLDALDVSAVRATGVEPRGMVALGSLERGRRIVIGEVDEALAARPPASLGGLVLSGVVDRLPLHGLLALVDQAHRALAPGAPLVVVAHHRAAAAARLTEGARDLLQPCNLAAQTWQDVLGRAGFAHVAPLRDAPDDESRFALTATVPA